MIFVTIGTMYGFPRLIMEMDRIAGQIDEEVIMQIGETSYEPINAKYFRFSSREEMNDIYKNSRIVVCHAGVGSILSALEYGKPIIVLPRSKEYGEAIDNHQSEIARELEKEGIIKLANHVNDLRNLMNGQNLNESDKIVKNEIIIVKKLKEYINHLTC